MSDTHLTDGALAIFAFAAYHQLQSGQPVKKVIIDDGSGHRADDEGRSKLQTAGLALEDGNFIVFTDAGLEKLATVIEGFKQIR